MNRVNAMVVVHKYGRTALATMATFLMTDRKALEESSQATEMYT